MRQTAPFKILVFVAALSVIASSVVDAQDKNPAFGGTAAETSSTGAPATSKSPTFKSAPPGGEGGSRATLMFTEPGHEIWIQAGPSTGPATDDIRSQDTITDLPLLGRAPADNVYIIDQKTGNQASMSVAKLTALGTWDVKDDEFKDIGKVSVKVEHGGQPVSAANVTLDDGRHPQSQLLDATTKGVVSFYGVKPGSLKVTVSYKAAGAAKSVTQLLDAPLKRADAVPSLVVSLPEDVPTVATPMAPTSAATGGVAPTGAGASSAPPAAGAGASAGAPAGGATPKEQGSNPVGSFLFGLVSLAIVGVLIFLAYRYATQNKDLVESKLQQLGVDIPKPADDPHQYDPIPVAPVKAAPPQKIMLDGADPIPLAPMGAPVAASPLIQLSASATGEPRLLSDTGDAMTLPPGETVVGREVGLGLSLVGESTVSRRHATLVKNGNEVILTDMGSTNGTYVNGSTISAPTRLNHGDAVQFGSVRFRYEA